MKDWRVVWGSVNHTSVHILNDVNTLTLIVSWTPLLSRIIVVGTRYIRQVPGKVSLVYYIRYSWSTSSIMRIAYRLVHADWRLLFKSRGLKVNFSGWNFNFRWKFSRNWNDTEIIYEFRGNKLKELFIEISNKDFLRLPRFVTWVKF